MAGKVIHFGAAVTAQQLPTIEAHSTEVLILDGGWGALLGSKSSGNESLFFRRFTVHLQWPLPSQRCDSDLSSPQPWALGGIRQAVLADLGEERSLSGRSTVLTDGWQGWGGVGGQRQRLSTYSEGLSLRDHKPAKSQLSHPAVSPRSHAAEDKLRPTEVHKRPSRVFYLVLAKRPRSNKKPGPSRAKWYLNGHARGLSATLDHQQETPVLPVLLRLQLKHGHLS